VPEISTRPPAWVAHTYTKTQVSTEHGVIGGFMWESEPVIVARDTSEDDRAELAQYDPAYGVPLGVAVHQTTGTMTNDSGVEAVTLPAAVSILGPVDNLSPAEARRLADQLCRHAELADEAPAADVLGGNR